MNDVAKEGDLDRMLFSCLHLLEGSFLNIHGGPGQNVAALWIPMVVGLDRMWQLCEYPWWRGWTECGDRQEKNMQVWVFVLHVLHSLSLNLLLVLNSNEIQEMTYYDNSLESVDVSIGAMQWTDFTVFHSYCLYMFVHMCCIQFCLCAFIKENEQHLKKMSGRI